MAAKLYGSEIPRIWTRPLAELTPETSRGFEAIQFAEDVVGLDLLPWQKWLLIHALELNPDGTFRFRTVVLLVSRQNGKSTLMQVLTLWRMYVDGAKLVIGTAQNLDIAEEQWLGAVEMAEGVPDLSDQIERVVKVNGKKALELVDGERYKVAAANRKGGRGLSGELVLMDELREHSNWDSWSAVTKTTLARKSAQVWAASNAGDAASIVLRFLRKLAHAALGNPDGLDDVSTVADDGNGDADTLGIFEWSAPPGVSVWDRAGWAQANPSLNYTLPEAALASAARTDPEGIFRTECLCQWLDTTADGPFPEGSWEAGADRESKRDGDYMFCVDVSWDRTTAHIGVAGRRSDGLMHVQVVASRSGTAWVTGWIEERKSDPDLMGVVIQANGAPASSLLSDLEAIEDLNVVPWAGSDLGRGTGMFYDHVRGVQASAEGDVLVSPGPLLRHPVQPVLDVAAAVAVTKPAGDAWLWDRAKSPVDIAPLVAVTGALWGFLAKQPEPAVRSKYEDNDPITIGGW